MPTAKGLIALVILLSAFRANAADDLSGDVRSLEVTSRNLQRALKVLAERASSPSENCSLGQTVSSTVNSAIPTIQSQTAAVKAAALSGDRSTVQSTLQSANSKNSSFASYHSMVVGSCPALGKLYGHAEVLGNTLIGDLEKISAKLR